MFAELEVAAGDRRRLDLNAVGAPEIRGGLLLQLYWEKRTVIELEVEDTGPSLRYATAAVTRTGAGPRQGTGQHPADSLTISNPDYGDDDPWFGIEANPGGRITLPQQQDAEPAD